MAAVSRARDLGDCLGGRYETVLESLDASAHPMPGQLIDVGGHGAAPALRRHRQSHVILQPGQGGVSSDRAWIAPAAAGDTTVCVYDRPGPGERRR